MAGLSPLPLLTVGSPPLAIRYLAGSLLGVKLKSPIGARSCLRQLLRFTGTRHPSCHSGPCERTTARLDLPLDVNGSGSGDECEAEQRHVHEEATSKGNTWTQQRVAAFRHDHGIAVYRDGERAERGEVTRRKPQAASPSAV